MLKENYESLDELVDDIENYKLKLTADYQLIFKKVKAFSYGATIGQYNDWGEVHSILDNLKQIVIVVIDRDCHLGDYDDNKDLINDNQDDGDIYEDIINIMDEILDQTLCIEPYCESEHFEIIEQNIEQAYKIIQDTIAYIKDCGYSECCDDIFYRWAVIEYDKVIEIVYRDASWDEDTETVVCTSFKEFQDFIRDEYHNYVRNKRYGHEGLYPTIFTITFGSKLYEKAPKLKVDLRNVGFVDMDIEDFAVTTLLTYLSENWNNMIGYDDIITSKEYDPDKGIEYTEDEKCLKNVYLFNMMTTADKNGDNDKMTLREFRRSDSLVNI